MKKKQTVVVIPVGSTVRTQTPVEVMQLQRNPGECPLCWRGLKGKGVSYHKTDRLNYMKCNSCSHTWTELNKNMDGK